MIDDFQLGTDTLERVEKHLATLPQALGTRDDPYDLSASAKFILPIDAPIRNALPTMAVAAEFTQTLATRQYVTFPAGFRAEGDIHGRRFAECLMALKLTENYHLRDKLTALGVPLDDLSALAEQYALGESRGYYGTIKRNGDHVVFTVCHDVCLLTPEPVHLVSLA